MPSTVVRVLWFIFVGWWLGLIWIGISLALMATVVLFPFGVYMISKTWEIMVLESSPTKVIEEGQNLSKDSSSNVQSSTASGNSKEFFKIDPTEFAYVSFDTTKDAKLEYSMKVYNGPDINAIVTYKDNLSEFKQSTNIGWVEGASAVDVGQTHQQSIIHPADYVLILDNSGRFGGQTPSGTAEVEVELKITK
jgi:hypothetical protein